MTTVHALRTILPLFCTSSFLIWTFNISLAFWTRDVFLDYMKEHLLVLGHSHQLLVIRIVLVLIKYMNDVAFHFQWLEM